MKSKMKKLVSLVLAMAMVFTMSAVVYADEPTTYTITVTNTESGHTYEAYQIFAGDLSSDGKLSNIKWGDGVDANKVDNLLAAIKAIEDEDKGTEPFASCTDAAGVAEILAGYTDDSAVAEAFADAISAYLSDTATGTSTEDPTGTYKISGLDAGYYLVKDNASDVPATGAYTDYILEVVGDVNVTAKASVPEVTKKVQEVNDSKATSTKTGEENPVWQDAADYDIDDSINYKLTGTMPSTLNDYSVYYYVFTDTLSKGLTFNQADSGSVANTDVTVTVYANDTATTGTVVASGYTVSLADYSTTAQDDPYEGGTVLTVTIEDVYKLYDENTDAIKVTSSSIIVVTYSATLNDDANIGEDGNPNEVVLTYSNNPNNAGKGETGTTPKDLVTVFTFKLEVNKTDGDGNELQGAAFTLYKYDPDTETYEEYATTTAGTATKFIFTGLDSGLYMLKETTTPNGYNTIDEIYFEVAAEYSKEADEPKLTALVIKDKDGDTVSGAPKSGKTYEVQTDYTLISTTIENKSGSVLPSTGGIGTTIFYIVGAILVLGAGVILVTRRRTASR